VENGILANKILEVSKVDEQIRRFSVVLSKSKIPTYFYITEFFI